MSTIRSTEAQETLSYRPEIDGLRAFAVWAVIVFHLNPNWLPGGFVGVDIFLVISGFLITRWIVSAHQNGTFSFAHFYEKRIKRILPLTYAVILSILAAGWFLTFPMAYRAEANSALAAVFFLANLRFALMGNYFGSSEDNPLLHLWSLSLEEQFYFLWPLVIAAIFKWGQIRRLPAICLVLTACSLALAMVANNIDSIASFSYFSLPTRAAGLTIGAALVLFRRRNPNLDAESVPFAGTMLLLASVSIANEGNFPGPVLLFPLAGASLVILSPNAHLTKRLYANRVATYFGKISFSLYMWHWPLLVFGRRTLGLRETDTPSFIQILLFTVVLIGISALSHRFVESPLRKSKLSSSRTFVFLFVGPSMVLAALALAVSKTNGLPSRYGLTDKMTRIETLECHNKLSNELCKLTEFENSPKLLLIGDSHAASLSHFVKLLAEDQKFSAYTATADKCLFFSEAFYSNHCESTKRKIARALNQDSPDAVMIALRMDKLQESEVNELIVYAKNLISNGTQVIFVKQVPMFSDAFDETVFMHTYLSGRVLSRSNELDAAYRKYDAAIESNLSGQTLDFTELLCNDAGCRMLDETGSPIYFDYNHLSAHGAEWLFSAARSSRTLIRLTKFENH